MATPFVTHEVFQGDYCNEAHKKVKKALAVATNAVDVGIDFTYPAATHSKVKSGLKAQSNLADAQCLEFLDSFSPLYLEIEGGGMCPKTHGSAVWHIQSRSLMWSELCMP